MQHALCLHHTAVPTTLCKHQKSDSAYHCALQVLRHMTERITSGEPSDIHQQQEALRSSIQALRLSGSLTDMEGTWVLLYVPV